MGTCILVISKINSFSEMSAAYKHNYRLAYIGNTIPELEKDNEELVSLNGRTYEEAFQDRIGALGYGVDKKLRKNGVLLLDIMTSFSREDLGKFNINKWKEENVSWLRDTFNANPAKYGDNVLSVVYHADEVGNVHCHSMVIPIDNKGRLSAYYYVKNPQVMAQLQTQYANRMKQFGLERGIEGTIAHHVDMKRFYGELNKVLEVDIPSYTGQDTPETYMEKVRNYCKDREAAYFQEIKRKDREIEILKSQEKRPETVYRKKYAEKAKELRKMEKDKEAFEREFGPVKDARKKLKTLELLTEGMKHSVDKDEMDQLARQMNEVVREEKERQREEKKRQKTVFENEKR